mgnify:CR=1 FL=1
MVLRPALLIDWPTLEIHPGEQLAEQRSLYPSLGNEWRDDRLTHAAFSDQRGICGSLINLAVGGDCPDSPTAIHPLAPGDENGASDNLALCIYRECMSDADCTAPLRCVPGTSGDPDTCGYDDGSLPPPDAGTDAATTDAPAITDAASDAASEACSTFAASMRCWTI